MFFFPTDHLFFISLNGISFFITNFPIVRSLLTPLEIFREGNGEEQPPRCEFERTERLSRVRDSADLLGPASTRLIFIRSPVVFISCFVRRGDGGGNLRGKILIRSAVYRRRVSVSTLFVKEARSGCRLNIIKAFKVSVRSEDVKQIVLVWRVRGAARTSPGSVSPPPPLRLIRAPSSFRS